MYRNASILVRLIPIVNCAVVGAVLVATKSPCLLGCRLPVQVTLTSLEVQARTSGDDKRVAAGRFVWV